MAPRVRRARQPHRCRPTRPGNTTRYTYDDTGHLTAVTDALGPHDTVRCDAAGLPVEITDPLGAVTRYERDAFGRPVAHHRPARRRHPSGVDGRGQARPPHRPRRHRGVWTYDGEGNCTTHTDACGGVTRFEYTHFDLLAARTGPDGVRHEFDHDAELRLTKVTNPQGLTWDYDLRPRRPSVSETDFDDRTLTYELRRGGPAGRPHRRPGRDGHLRARRARPARPQGRRRRRSPPTPTTRPATARGVGPDAEVALQRDQLGRVKSGDGQRPRPDVRLRRPGPPHPPHHPHRRGHHLHLRRGRQPHVADGQRPHPRLHPRRGRPRNRPPHRRRRSPSPTPWDPAGRLTSQTRHRRRARRRIQHRAYTYRADGHLTGIDDQLTGTRTLRPRRGRPRHRRPRRGWTRDATPTTRPATRPAPPGPPATPAPKPPAPAPTPAPRITRAGKVRYEHDAAGRITLRQKTRLSKKPDTWRYTWDTEDRLTSVTTPDGTRWRYLYDPLGRRTAKQRLGDDGETVVEQVDFTWDGHTLCEQTTTGAGSCPTRSPSPGTTTACTHWPRPNAASPTQPPRTRSTPASSPSSPTSSAPPPNSSTSRATSPGTPAPRCGAPPPGTPTATTYTPLRFPGQYYDPETGLHYNYFRHYDPDTARYASPDPLGLAPAPNPATYVTNPHTWTDPLGLFGCDEKKPPPRLSDPLPQGLPKTFVREYDEIRAGRGTPQTDPHTGQPKIFEGRRPHEAPWKDAEEYRVPGAKDPENSRILVKTLPDGRKVMGWTTNHYDNIHTFKAPHFPDDGWR